LARERIPTVVVKQKTMSASSSSVTGAPHASDDHQRSSSSKQDSNLTTGGRSGNLYPIGAKKTPARVFPTAAKNAAKKKPLRRGSVHQDTSWSKKLSKAPGSREASGTSADDSAEGGAATSVAAPAPETATVTCYIMVDMSAKQFQDLSEAGGTSAPCKFSCEGLGRIQFQTNDGEEAALVMLNGHDNMKISLGSDDAEVSHCDAPEPPSSLQAEFKAGASVRIYGLINAKHFNGVRATCESFDDISGAWSVKLTTGETKKLMPDNLQLVVPSELRARFTELTRELIEAEETLPDSVRDMAPGTPPRQRSDEEIKNLSCEPSPRDLSHKGFRS